MHQSIRGSQQQVDRHAAKTGVPGSHLPAGTDQYALIYNGTTGKWEPAALPGTGVAASKGDPLNLGFPFTVDPLMAAVSTGVGSANRTYYHRVIGGGSVSKLGLYVATASGNICASVYANSGTGRAAAPGARLATTGSIACPAVGYQELALGTTITVTSGDFWFALSADNATAAFDVVSTSGHSIQGRSAWQDSAFPSPTPATPSNGAGSGGGSRAFCLVGVA